MTPKTRIRVFALTCVTIVSIAHTLVGFSLFDRRWPTGEIVMEVQLGGASGLIDGSASWDDCGINALVQWNHTLGGTGVSFTPVRNSTRTPAAGDNVNSVFFSDDVFGVPFGAQTLAITQTFVSEVDGIDRTVESDVLFNNGQRFNCYREAQRPDQTAERSITSDLQRVALHGFGHVLGLNHPDEDIPPQTATAIMNAIVSDTDVLQPDDIRGALTLHGVAVTGIPFPPRDQVLTFYLDLENEYRVTLERQQNNPGHVNVEGVAVWLPEFLRYVLNGCAAPEATRRVLLNIATGAIQPVCGVVESGGISFPPRHLSLDFLATLDTYYRDVLNENALNSRVDPEGKAVWLEVYLGYRGNGCNHQEATDRVFQQIRTGIIAPSCTVQGH